MRVAVLDDYQNYAQTNVDWGDLIKEVEIFLNHKSPKKP